MKEIKQKLTIQHARTKRLGRAKRPAEPGEEYARNGFAARRDGLALPGRTHNAMVELWWEASGRKVQGAGRAKRPAGRAKRPAEPGEEYVRNGFAARRDGLALPSRVMLRRAVPRCRSAAPDHTTKSQFSHEHPDC